MTDVNGHAPGAPCWAELTTTDRKAATAFYREIFGWEMVETPMGPDEVYVILQKRGRDAAALYQQREAGIPSHWTIYFSVASADAAAEQVKALGGAVVAGPFDAMEYGRMAAVADPTGATFALWEARKNPGIGIEGEPGTFCWSELMTPDAEAARRFYTALFGWIVKGDAHYTEWHLGDRGIGGMMETKGEQWQGVPAHWMPYFWVESCDATAASIQALGGHVRVPPNDIPDVGRFAIVGDPQGAGFAIFTPK